MNPRYHLQDMSDDELVRALGKLVSQRSKLTALLLAHIHQPARKPASSTTKMNDATCRGFFISLPQSGFSFRT